MTAVGATAVGVTSVRNDLDSKTHHVKQPVSVRSRVGRRKAILALLDQFTSFGQRELLTIHASSGSARMSAVSSGKSVDML